MSAVQPGPLRPTALRKQGDDSLAIDWNDGHQSVYSWKHLRAQCPCASCREEKLQPPNPLRLLTPAELAPKPPLAPQAVEPVGYYAYRIVWNDGHDTGLYTLENLRALCECERCQAK
ncbi:MAG: DUF971 domain-containing protein [Planctomycetia bacterium]|nr:DUF971 domain-containing protein [Planctomycetia bacterium]